ncbi:MAG TPA: ABC transporter substrate-binding protein [Petrotogaceae bacterium]|jgi:iron complex transport system substrate-binding protein|nr:ABC transporter substrate-binding protein [Petrotogaceae bacterium]HOG33504.1 ABC transporter substrate-binding protein [Petrotogaceae bacterium]HPA92728.1 ABC transporter substrate-binding protein [Petrotogaceae bacterium]HPX15278.1 ABC transporter substrate-binding protein [Petrotogaceae bacterium]HQC40345.1 ABC transporter substrate-binding protein [Petrotogaceae bacterium]
MIRKAILVLGILIIGLSAFSLHMENSMIYGESGESVPVASYKKIVVIDPSSVEVLYLLGAQESIAAIGHTAKSPIWPYDKTPALASVGSITKPSLEKVLSYTPDLVLLNAMIGDFGLSLKQHSINYLIVNADSVEDILDNLEILGVLCGKEKEAITLSQEKKSKLKKIKADILKNPLNMKGIFLYSTNPIMAFNSTSLSGQILEVIGVKNIAADLSADKPILSAEYILQQNPDFIIGAMSITSPQQIKDASPLIKSTSAAKKDKIFLIDSSKILRPSPRIVDEIENLYLELKK